MTEPSDHAPSALLKALHKRDWDGARSAIANGDDVRSVDTRPIIGDNLTALHLAIGDIELLRLILSLGADVNAVTTVGQTPLWLACNDGNFESAQVLLEQGADPNIASSEGYAPLDRVRASNVRLIELLRGWGANG